MTPWSRLWQRDRAWSIRMGLAGSGCDWGWGVASAADRGIASAYHARSTGVVAAQLAEFGRCTVIDCHSFPSVPKPSEVDQAPDRPDICIGTDEVHAPADLATRMETAFVGAGFRVKRDSPFAGTFVPSGCYGRDSRVVSVMIEVRRDLYVDEATSERAAHFDAVSDAMTAAVCSALAVAQGPH